MPQSERVALTAGGSRRALFSPLGPLFGTAVIAAMTGVAANAGMKAISIGVAPRVAAVSALALWWIHYYATTVAGRIVIGDGRLEIDCVHWTTVIELARIEIVSLRCIPHTLSGGYQSIRVKQTAGILARTFRYNGATLQSQEELANALRAHGVKVNIKNRPF